MRIFNFLSKSSKLFGLGLFGLGIVSGLSGTLLVVISSRVIVLDPYSQVFYRDLFFIYTLLMFAYFIIQRIYQTILIKISQSVIWRVRLQVLDRIRNADFYRLQNYGSAELYTILTTDTENISFASSTLASAVTSVVTIFCCLGYLVWLTPLGFMVTLVLMSLVAITYWVRQQKIVKILRQVRDKEDEFFKYTQHLIHGIKEIKMDRSRSEDLYINYLNNTAIETEQLKVSASTAFMNNSLLGQLYFFITLGCFLFIFPYFGIHLLNNSSQYVIIILYLMAPAQNIAQLIPHLNYAEISINRLEKLAHKLSEDKQVAQANTPFTASGFESLTFDKASYTYGNNANENSDFFKVGPFDLKLEKNEIVFISGANGSGKSTFVRLMTGLYYPSEGSILVNSTKITKESIQSYRDMISVVFTDGYLFDTLYGGNCTDSDLMRTHLHKFNLDKKVTFENRKFSNVNLSDGQKKRLILASSLMEEKSIIVFDELAANQDPEFKEYFYHELLPELKRKQKTVIVVTHDDRYFHCADRHILMENGHISFLPKTMLGN